MGLLRDGRQTPYFRRMSSKSNDLEKELQQNLKLRRDLKGEIAKAETGGQLMHSRWLRLRDWFVVRWLDFQGWLEDRRRRRR